MTEARQRMQRRVALSAAVGASQGLVAGTKLRRSRMILNQLFIPVNLFVAERAVRLGDAPTFNRGTGSQDRVEVRFLSSPPIVEQRGFFRQI